METMVDENVRDYLSTWTNAFVKSLEVQKDKEPIMTAIQETQQKNNEKKEISGPKVTILLDQIHES